jgi:hypothetical protein
MLALYRRLITARREHLDGAPVELIDTGDDVIVLRRNEVIVACNVGSEPVDLVAAAGLSPLLTTEPGGAGGGTIVPGDTTVWFAPAR